MDSHNSKQNADTLVEVPSNSAKKLVANEGLAGRNTEANLGLGKSVVNLSDENLSDLEINVLSKGLSFIPTPADVNIDSFKSSIADFNRKIRLSYFWSHRDMTSKYDDDYVKLPFTGKSDWEPPDQLVPAQVHDILSELDTKVSEMQPIKDKINVSAGQVNALKQLRNKRHLIIKKADKGASVVVMNKSDYILEANRQLDNPRHYQKLQ